MCWNKEVSFTSWILIYIGAFYLYKRNLKGDRHIAIFSFVFGIVQLLEYFLWYSLETNNSTLNSFITKLLFLALWLQPLSNFILICTLNSNSKTNKKPEYIKWVIYVYGLIFLYAINLTFNSSYNFKTIIGENNHLQWIKQYKQNLNAKNEQNFLSLNPKIDSNIFGLIYLFGMFVPFLFFNPQSRGKKLLIITMFSYFFSHVMSPKNMGSYWCWVAGFVTYSSIFIK